MAPLITLTTDFGLSDHYVGTMKGVILSRCPAANVVDICHGVTPFSIWEGAYTIAQAASFFPPATIHVVVVDPGVGTSRKAILVESQQQFFVAPDNGVLSFFLADATVRELANANLFLKAVSSTFHGRDVFAAVAGSLAAGTPPQEVGALLQTPVTLEGMTPQSLGVNRWAARVLSVDHFGNVITNVPADRLQAVTFETGQGVLNRRYATFAQALAGEIFLYPGSSGFIEIALNQGRAADALSLLPGDLLHYQN